MKDMDQYCQQMFNEHPIRKVKLMYKITLQMTFMTGNQLKQYHIITQAITNTIKTTNSPDEMQASFGLQEKCRPLNSVMT